MTILTVEEFKLLTPTSLDDDALQILLDAAEEAIIAHAGAPTTAVELFDGSGRYLVLRRPAASITSITQTDSANTVTTLAANDYLLHPGAMVVQRLSGGTTGGRYWRDRVAVTYVPVSDENERKRVQAALVESDLNYQPGTTSEQIGAWMEQMQRSSVWNYETERASILASLGASHRPQMVVIG